jgi:hypothetical protein
VISGVDLNRYLSLLSLPDEFRDKDNKDILAYLKVRKLIPPPSVPSHPLVVSGLSPSSNHLSKGQKALVSPAPPVAQDHRNIQAHISEPDFSSRLTISFSEPLPTQHLPPVPLGPPSEVLTNSVIKDGSSQQHKNPSPIPIVAPLSVPIVVPAPGNSETKHNSKGNGDATPSSVIVIPRNEIEIRSQLSSGGFSTVHRAEWRGSTVAFKAR